MITLLPLGIIVLLLIAAERHGEASRSHALSLPPHGGGKNTRDKAVTKPKIHRGFYPPPGSVMVVGDATWSWDGRTWAHNGLPAFPQGKILVGVPGGPLDGWAYDWVYRAWYEPGALVHKGFYPPAGAVGVKGDSSWYWNGHDWLKNGKASFPESKELVGVKGGPLDGWTYNWKLQAWVEPGAVEALLNYKQSTEAKTAQKTTAKKSGGFHFWSTDEFYPKPEKAKTRQGQASPASVPASYSAPWREEDNYPKPSPKKKEDAKKAVVELARHPDPHPQHVYNTAAQAADAGFLQTAQELTGVAWRKADEKGQPRPMDVAPVPAHPQAISSAQVATLNQHASELADALHNLDAAGHPSIATPPIVPPAQATMTFPPEVITHSQADMSFAPEEITHSLPSPLDGVSDGDWTAFESMMEDASNKVSPDWKLGRWKITARRLQDLGMAKDARQVNRDGKTVWIADFIPPLSMQIFVNDEHLQYDTFVKEMHFLSDGIEKMGAAGKVPLEIHGIVPTRSGLLAVAKLAGLQGLESFVKTGSKDWDKFPNTRDAFLKFNGMF